MSAPAQPDSRYAANIPRYFAYQALKSLSFGLFAATWVIFLQERRGLSLAQATLLDVTFFVVAAVGELPTGIVADQIGRKASLMIGAALQCLGVFGWTLAPTMPLIMLAYVALGIGVTFLSGAEDAFFYETLQIVGRGADYRRLAGRAGSTLLGGLALGSVAGGLLSAIDLITPFLVSGICLLLMFGVVLTFKEPRRLEADGQSQPRAPFGAVLRQCFRLMRARPTLRYPMIYLALVPVASFMIESVLLQPQSVALGVPIAGIGVIVMAVQLVNMAGSGLAERLAARFGEGRLLYAIPPLIVIGLVLLAALQVLPGLALIGAMGFLTAAVRPLVLTRIQHEASDDIRATIISVQSLMFTFFAAICQPTMGFVADRAGFPAAYLGLAISLGLLSALLFWCSRGAFPAPPADADAAPAA